MENGDPQIKVVYIGGVEHNGSTFLGVALGNHPQIVCVGELSSQARLGWLDNECCACGLSIKDCQFWTDVKEEWMQSTEAEINSLIKIEREFDFRRRLPNAILQKYVRSSSFDEYSWYTSALLNAVRQISGKSIIVDTSKRYSRAIALSFVPSVDLRVIHLIRDSRGVAYSWSKSIRAQKRGWLDSSLRWNINNIAFEYVNRVLGEKRVRRIRYEDLLSDPVGVMEEIGNFIDVNLSELGNYLYTGSKLNKYHIGVGNGFLRRAEDVKLRSEIDWPQQSPEEIQHKVWNITRPLMRYYGYEKR